MIYEYYCPDCKLLVDVEKSLAQIDRPEFCSACDYEMERQLSANVSFQNEKAESNEAFYHPALGQVVKSEKHAREVAKQKGFIEVGNESQNDLSPQYKDYSVSRRDFDEVMGIGEVGRR